MTKRIFGLSFLLSLLILIVTVACGGGGQHRGGGGGGSLFSAARLSQTTLHGMHIHSARRTTTASLSWGDSLLPSVQAATLVAVDQNWEGICSGSPVTTGTVSFTVYGIGQNTFPRCDSSWAPTPEGAAANAVAGKIVFGAGTFSNLVVSTELGTVIATPEGVPVHLWVKRSGAVTDTGIECVLPSGSNELVCRTDTAFPVLDLDHVIATATVGPDDRLVGLTVNFTKVLP
jgi:hypothetical protein